MKARLSRHGSPLLWAVLLLPLAISCATSKDKPDPAENLRAGIRDVVADPGRVSKMLAAVDELQLISGELDMLIAEEQGSLATLLRDYGTSRAEVETSLVAFNTRREHLAQRLLTTHAAVKAEATAPEWKKLRKLELEMIAFAAGKSIGQAAPAGEGS
jgi:hypothetical protein